LGLKAAAHFAMTNMELASFNCSGTTSEGLLGVRLYVERKLHEVIRLMMGQCHGQELVNEERMFWLCW